MEAAEESTTAFGLTAKVLVQLKQDLAAAHRDATIDRKPPTVTREIQQQLGMSIVVDSGARTILDQAPAIQDQLQGLAAGTVLAAVLRPHGLGFIPEQDRRGSIALRIVAAATVKEVWPIGWPSQQRDQQVVPKLFEFLPVEIVDTPLRQALDALQPRLGVPVLLDHNGLAARQIDLDTVKVHYPAGRTFYKRLLEPLVSSETGSRSAARRRRTAVSLDSTHSSLNHSAVDSKPLLQSTLSSPRTRAAASHKLR